MNDKLNNVIENLIKEIPRNEWGDFLEAQNLHSGDLNEMSFYLEQKAVLLCEIAEYLDTRGGYGCGDSGHQKAAVNAQKKRKKIRKALGYSYP